MVTDQIIDEFKSITTWKRGGQRAPHKPLLVLYALGKLLKGEEQLKFSAIESDIRYLLNEFGPNRKSYHPEYPFWRLKNDKIWVLSNVEGCKTRKSNSDPKISELRKFCVKGGFRKDLASSLKADFDLLSKIVGTILEMNFPESIHSDILDACEINLDLPPAKCRRSKDFRFNVLSAYQFRCAVCGYNANMGGLHIGLEAAHVKWHIAGGPNSLSNGIALCANHHKLFDRGGFTIRNRRLILSENLFGDDTFRSTILSLHGKCVEQPIYSSGEIDKTHLDWHRREVFHGKGRELIQ